jgi:hypothetical protein
MLINQSVDLAKGTLVTNSDWDLRVEPMSNQSFMLKQCDTCQLVMFGKRVPAISECLRLLTPAQEQGFSQEYLESYFCYKTREGLPGYLVVREINPQLNSVFFDFVTWFAP